MSEDKEQWLVRGKYRGAGETRMGGLKAKEKIKAGKKTNAVGLESINYFF